MEIHKTSWPMRILVVLLFLYRPYAAVILAAASWATAKPRHLLMFLGAIVAIPLVLLFL